MHLEHAESILLVLAFIGAFTALGFAHLNERFYHAYGFFAPFDPETRGRHEIAANEQTLVREESVRGGINLTLATGLELGFKVVLTSKALYVAYSTARPNYWLMVRPWADIESLRCITILGKDAVEINVRCATIHTVNFITAQKESWREAAVSFGKLRDL